MYIYIYIHICKHLVHNLVLRNSFMNTKNDPQESPRRLYTSIWCTLHNHVLRSMFVNTYNGPRQSPRRLYTSTWCKKQRDFAGEPQECSEHIWSLLRKCVRVIDNLQRISQHNLNRGPGELGGQMRLAQRAVRLAQRRRWHGGTFRRASVRSIHTQ